MPGWFFDHEFAADPYPGAVPDCSFVHTESGRCAVVTPDAGAPCGWGVPAGETDLEQWLLDHDAPGLAGRVPVLAYGSNKCPAKIGWLRATLGLTGPAVVLRVRCTGLAAVWAAGLRARDGARPATLAVLDGVVERHAVWLATADQLQVLDVCEGRGERYQLGWVRGSELELDDGSRLAEVLAYVAAAPARAPLRVDGVGLVRCAEVDQRAALTLTGTPDHTTTPRISYQMRNAGSWPAVG